MSFDQTTDEIAFGSFVLPAEWDGVLLRAIAYWEGPGLTGNVIWALDVRGVADDELLSQTLVELGTVTDTRLGGSDLHISDPIIWDGSTPALTAGDFVQFGIRRNASAGGDNIAADVDLVGVMIEYDVNTP